MSTFKKPAAGEGWMRALLFLVIFSGVYLFGNWLIKQTSLLKSLGPVYANASIFALSALVLVPLFWLMVDKKPLSAIGFSWKINTNDGLLGLLMAVAMLGVGSLTLYLNNNLNYSEATAGIPDLLTGLILMSVIAVAEEAVFRGYILNNLLGSLDRWLALIVSALVFALLHSANPEASLVAVVNVFLAGLLLGLAFVFTHNLWFAIFFHFSWNFIQGPILGFPVSGLKVRSAFETTINGPELLTGGEFGFEASIIQTILFFIAIVVLYLFFKRRDSL